MKTLLYSMIGIGIFCIPVISLAQLVPSAPSNQNPATGTSSPNTPTTNTPGSESGTTAPT